MMTTDETTVGNAELSADELQALRMVADGMGVNRSMAMRLVVRHVVIYDGTTFDPEKGYHIELKINDTGRALLAASEPEPQPEAVGWYVSSVVQWIPEYSTEKINGHDGPFPTWRAALEFLFKEVDKDIETDHSELATLKGRIAYLEAITTESYNAIWLAVRGSKVGEWDYPAMVARYAEYQRDELATVKAERDGLVAEVVRLLKMQSNLLTLEEQRILEAVNENKELQMSYGMWCHMTSKLLISSNEERGTHWLTEYGKTLLQALANQQPGVQSKLESEG